jgi:hypothetical protein
MPNTDYIRYHDDLEQKQENEDAIIDSVVASMMRVNQHVFDKHRHAKRDAHAKSHGVLVGHVTVYDNLPAYLAQGVFAKPARYPVVLRLSTAPGDVHSDKVPTPRGMAIKMLGVSGHQFLPQRQQASTQDLLLVNHPVIAFGHAAAYLQTQKLLEKHMDDPDITKRIIAALASGGSKALHAFGIDNPIVDTLGAPNTHILGETFFSMAAVRYGDYVAKLCAAPVSSKASASTPTRATRRCATWWSIFSRTRAPNTNCARSCAPAPTGCRSKTPPSTGRRSCRPTSRWRA